MAIIPENYLVLTALGSNQLTLVEEISRLSAQCGCSIHDSRMTVLGQEFALIMMLAGSWSSIAKLEASLPALEQRLNLRTLLKRTTLKEPDLRGMPYIVQVIALDRPGILNEIADFFTVQGIPIIDVFTESYTTHRTNSLMFSLTMTVQIIEKIHISSLRERFMIYCEDRNLDAILEPDKN